MGIMAQYYKPSLNSKSDPFIKDIQLKLNAIRLNYHGNWDYLVPDGIYGLKTRNAVKAFQIFKNITPVSGVLGPTTSMYINQQYCNIPQLKAAPQVVNSKEDNELGRILFKFYKATSDMVVEFMLGIQKDYANNTKRLVNDWNILVNKIRTRLLQLISKFKTNKGPACEQLARYWKKREKLSPNRIVKSNKYSQNIETLLNKHLGTSHIKLDYNKVYKQLKLGKFFSGAGKAVKFGDIDLYKSIWKVGEDINSINDSQAWLNNWTKDINGLIDVLIGLIIGTIVVLLLPEEMALLLVCLIAGAVCVLVSWILECFHKTYIGQIVDNTIGEKTAILVKSWLNEMNDIKIKNKMAEEAWINSQDTITIKLFK